MFDSDDLVKLRWKMNARDDTRGWYYMAPERSAATPPEGWDGAVYAGHECNFFHLWKNCRIFTGLWCLWSSWFSRNRLIHLKAKSSCCFSCPCRMSRMQQVNGPQKHIPKMMPIQLQWSPHTRQVWHGLTTCQGRNRWVNLIHRISHLSIIVGYWIGFSFELDK